MGLNSHHIIDFSELNKADLDLVGRKAQELGELKQLGIPIPDGFVVTTSFFKEFLDQTGISEEILEVQKLNHPAIAESIERLFDPIKKKIMDTHIPEHLTLELHKFYKKLAGLFKDRSLNIFSSSPSDNKSVIFKNVKGDANLILKIKAIWASQIKKPVAIIIQKNINSEKRGKITTADPRLSASLAGELGSASVPTKELENLAQKIQKHFYFPKDIDYVIEKGKIYITQVKPFTGAIDERPKRIEPKKLRKILIKGSSINPGIAIGHTKILNQALNFAHIKKDEIIVLPKLDSSLYKNLKNAKAVIIENILSTSYDKMIYRKIFKAPTIEGAKHATKILQNGNVITVNGISGEIYQGGLQ